jgi:2-(1,2-epoxy-1,2-dihydrophenyl)acetyl-CoA isomerase
MTALLYDVDDSSGIATITLNRPERHNTLSMEMVDLFIEALRSGRRDDRVKVIIVTGAGDRAFCAGGDLASGPLVDAERTAPVDNHRNLVLVHEIAWELRRLDKPYLAAINGAAIGAGMDIASMADLRFASEGARFGMGYVRVGLIPGDGGAYYLPRIVGLSRALHLIWTGEVFDAAQALAWDYVSAVHPADQLMQEVREYAGQLAEGPTVAIRASKRLTYRSTEIGEEQALELAAATMPLMMATKDAAEGRRAHQEKRPPMFQGR